MDSSSNRGSTGQLSSTGSGGGGGGVMHHSHSTPAGVDGGARTPPATPKKGGKMLAMRVQMLDDTITIFQVQAKALGRVLFDQVCKQLHLLEADYFGLEYCDIGGTRYWLDLQKPISRQLGLSLVDPLLYFCVKFYTPDPGQLEEEYTRYLFCLQVKRDLAQGLMQCNENTAALMASYIVQAECGDYVAEDYPDHTYLSSYKFVPQQDQEMERKIMENHKKHAGQSPAEADLNLLETARRCELYGMKMHPAKDHENVPLNLAVAHMGILVFQNYTKINTFSWAKIRKISFKRKRFLIKLHPEGYGYYKDTVEFFFEGRNECKNFWKKCVENHGFFRCSSVKHVSRHKTRVLSRGSSFRYSGKTQKQIVEFVRDNYVKRQAFQRSASFRHSSAHSSASNMHSSTVGNSISAHPLLPLADSNLSVEASKLSASLGSMGAAVAPGSPTTKSAYRHRVTATSWNSTPDTTTITIRPPATIINNIQMMSSPSPPLTMQSASPVTSVTMSPHHHHHTQYEDHLHYYHQQQQQHQKQPFASSSPVAVHAAVHRADTGIITTINTNTIIPHRTTTVRTPSSHKSEGSLDYSPIVFNNYPSQTQSQNDLGFNNTNNEYIYKSVTVLPKRQLWQRSASCRDLYDFSFEDSGQAKRRKPKTTQTVITTTTAEKLTTETRKLDSPITRYDDHPIYNTYSRDSSLEIHQDIMMPDKKVYSSSYPGTVQYLQESLEDPGNYDLRDSQDDLSHDSYELIEKSDDDASFDYRYKKKPFRSCSLDSGHYIPSDTDSELEKRYNNKCKSSSDVHHYDILMLEDPRDFPREIIPRKSDGNFYKHFKSSKQYSLELKNDYYCESESKLNKEIVCKHKESAKSADNLVDNHFDSRASSLDSKSEYYDANESISKYHDYDRKINFERNYGTQKIKPPTNFLNHENGNKKETSRVHSISLQNVETDYSYNRTFEQNTVPRTHKPNYKTQSSVEQEKTTYIWPEAIEGLSTEIPDWPTKQSTRSTDTDSNIFSFDEDKIQSLQDNGELKYSVVANIDKSTKKRNFRDIFMEIEPRKGHDSLPPLHQPIERTKSDPNSLARQRINNLNSKRLLLMHQKSFDLTPAESSDEDYLYKQIPSAPPITKYKGGGAQYFEMPTAEFGHFDVLKRNFEGEKTKFEVPKRQFEVLGAKTQSDFINLPPKSNDIPYVLHKRHITSETPVKDEIAKQSEVKLQEPTGEIKKLSDELKMKSKLKPMENEQFLFTQNIDLSKVDPVTLEVDKSEQPIHYLSSPKRDITHIDPVLLEALNSKLSQIESDSPTSSKTESLKQHQQKLLQKEKQKLIEVKHEPVKVQQEKFEESKIKDKIKTNIKPKRVIKPRMQPKKGVKTTRTKVRITSFSSDDESLDSDDVFGSAEATPVRMEFSPPQMRKEMESILKFESERKYLQYTMSSTEVEGSPPTTRKKTDKTLQLDNGLDPNNIQTELRRISERSISIPSSEDDLNIKTTDLQPVFVESSELTTVPEHDEKSISKDTSEINLDEEREKEKLLLQAEIENDLKDLKVPIKTKITEITSPSTRRKGQSPLLFAHARLNLSEGSAFTLLQKQQATESPTAGRRAKSLDTPIVPVNRLPPLNSFSSKDDTVEEEQPISTDFAESEQDTKIKEKIEKKLPEKVSVSKKSKIDKERDQIVPDVPTKLKKSTKVQPQLKILSQKISKTKTAIKPTKDLPKITKLTPKIAAVKPSVPPKTKIITKIVTRIDDSDTKAIPPRKSLPTPTSLAIPEVTEMKRAKSQEIETSKKIIPKEKAKSLDKFELKMTVSRERSKSQDDSDTDIAKRKEKQQMLYETAIKQTKTLKSPVKDVLPVFPQVEEMVRERHGKLEISINTIENSNVSLEEAIIITKSPKKLDKKMDKKLTKSLELNLTNQNESEDDGKPMARLGKSLDLDNRPKEEEKQQSEFDFKIETINKIKDMDEISPEYDSIQEVVKADVHKENVVGEDESPEHENIILEGTSLDLWLSMNEENQEKNKLDKIKLIQKSNDFFEQGQTTPKPPDLKSSSDSTSLEKNSLGNFLDVKYIDDSGDSSHKSEQNAELIAEMQKATNTMGKFLKRKLEKRKLEETNKIEEDAEIQKATNTVGKFLKKKLEKRKLDESLAKEEMIGKLEDVEMQKATDTLGKFLKKKLEKRKVEVKKESEEDIEIQKATNAVGKSLKKKLERRKLEIKKESEEDPEIQKATSTVGKFLKKKLERRKLESAVNIKTQENLKLDEEKAELQKATDTVGKFLKKKLEKRKIFSDRKDIPVRITNEEKSLNDVNELKEENDQGLNLNLLTIGNSHKDTLLKLSIERSRSEDTGSWMTVECDEFIGTESSLDYDQTPVDTKPIIIEEKLLTPKVRHSKLDLLKRSSDQSKSSDTTGSWTSGEKDNSPGNNNVKETDDSSLSCTMGRTVGFSQTIEKFATKEQIDDAPRSPRSPRICVLGRAFTIDEESTINRLEFHKDGSSSDEAVHDIPKDLVPVKEMQETNGVKYKKKPYPFEEKWSTDSEFGLRLQQKIVKKLSGDKSLSIEDSLSGKKKSLDKPSLLLVEKLSTESRNSVDTESSSGSFGVAVRMQKSNDIPKELSSTWKPFPLESSGSESFEDCLLPPDQDLDKQEYFLRRDNSGDFQPLSDICYPKTDDITPTKDDTELPEDLANFPANFGYPCLTSNISGLGLSINTNDVLGNYSSGFLSRTLSRISERSTNSEKSSLEEDLTKGSTQSDSLNDESLASSNPQVSFSSDPPSNAHVYDADKKTPTNDVSPSKPPLNWVEHVASPVISNLLLQRQISDDRRTSAEMAELSMDDIEIITSERGLKLKRQESDDTIIDEEEYFVEEKNGKKLTSSQESEEWPLPEIPQQRNLLAMHEFPSSDMSQQTTQVYQLPKTSTIPKTFCLRGSLKSEGSEQWPSPPSSITEPPIVGNIETYYITPAEEACKVTVMQDTSLYDNDSNSEDKTIDDKTHTYENVATEHISESISESLSVDPGIKIVLDSNKSDSNSDDSNLNDDVFTNEIAVKKGELRPPTVMRRSSNSDDSSHAKPKSSASSYSEEEEEESSVDTNIENDTVRYAVQPTKCTHSSHSEDTSIALSLSEWSNSASTVKFQNLSSNSGTKSSSGLKSDDNSLTDIAHSISDWSSSNSKNQTTASIQFQKLSSTTSTGDSTLTDFIPTISEWSTSSDSKTLVPQTFYTKMERTSVTRLGSSLDDGDDKKTLPSPKNIPSEDLAQLSIDLARNEQNFFTKSTERPIVIPAVQSESDTSSMEQKTVHTQRYDKENKRTYAQKHQTKSTERPIKVPLKLSKCSPYYSSSLSSESTPLAGTSPISKTATVPLIRTHRRPIIKPTVFPVTKSPPSENDSTSSVESPRSKSERDRRGYRRRRSQTLRRQQRERDQQQQQCYFGEEEIKNYNEYLRSKSYENEGLLQQQYTETLEEGYIPDGDSGSDVFRMEKDDDNYFDLNDDCGSFDVTSIPPPLLEDNDFDDEHLSKI